MDTKWQALILILVVLSSIFLANNFVFHSVPAVRANQPQVFAGSPSSVERGATLYSAQAAIVKSVPTRDWGVLDPEVSAHAVLIQSLDDRFPFYHFNTYAEWPSASLAKLLTTMVVLEDVGLSKRIEITDRAVATEGLSGGLRSGEIYSAEDLLKIMLLTSSNDAATAFEDSVEGRDNFVRLMNKKAREIEMSNSIFYDAAGLSELNEVTANDVLRLIKYVLEKHPEVFNWTRMPSFLVQPINGLDSRIVNNINSLVFNSRFLGGKTGTSNEALENLAAVFSFRDQRIAVIILGSKNRLDETKYLLDWIRRAYNLYD